MSCVAVSHTVSFSDICIPPVIQNLSLYFKLTASQGTVVAASSSIDDICKRELLGFQLVGPSLGFIVGGFQLVAS